MHAVSTYTVNPAAPMPLPIAWHPPAVVGTSIGPPVTTAFARPENTALTSSPGAVPLPTAALTSRSGVLSSTAPTSGATTSPTTVVTTIPGDSAVPIDRNHSAPLARMWGTFDRVSTLLTRVGFGPPVASERGVDSHPSWGA